MSHYKDQMKKGGWNRHSAQHILRKSSIRIFFSPSMPQFIYIHFLLVGSLVCVCPRWGQGAVGEHVFGEGEGGRKRWTFLKQRIYDVLNSIDNIAYSKKSLAGCSIWGCKKLYTTEHTHKMFYYLFGFHILKIVITFCISVVSRNLVA